MQVNFRPASWAIFRSTAESMFPLTLQSTSLVLTDMLCFQWNRLLYPEQGKVPITAALCPRLIYVFRPPQHSGNPRMPSATRHPSTCPHTTNRLPVRCLYYMQPFIVQYIHHTCAIDIYRFEEPPEPLLPSISSRSAFEYATHWSYTFSNPFYQITHIQSIHSHVAEHEH